MRTSLAMKLCGLVPLWRAFPGRNKGISASARLEPLQISALILLAACLLANPAPAQTAQTVQPQVLKGHVPKITKKLRALHRLEAGTQLNLAIGLPLRNRPQLTNLLQQLYDPSSPNFRHFLKSDEFATAFGPSESDYQAVIDFAKSHGLKVKKNHTNRTLLDVSGSVADIENAFHVHMQVYQHPVEKRTFFAPDAEPSLDLAVPVLAISGLDDYVTPRPHIHAAVRPDGGGQGGGGGGGGGSGPSGLYMGYDFQGAYTPQTVLDGTGQIVGIFELTGYDPNDIDTYISEADLPGTTTLTNVLIDGFDGDDSQYPYPLEACADIEMAMSMAPGLSEIIVYEGPTPLYDNPLGTNAIQYPSTTAQINDVLNQMAVDNLASQLSSSYQMDINLSTVQIFEQFAAQGQSFFQASGDFGAYAAAIDQPSDDPYITVVGGTTLNTASDGSWQSEVVWLTPAMIDPLLGNTPLVASGGGFSTTYGIPTWQQGISMAANQGSTTMRNLPDVSLVANNVDVVFGDDYIGLSFDFPEAGTSLSTPLWAGFTALVNQQAALNGQPRVGFINPALYAIAKSTNYNACFHDITTGNNFNPSSPTKFSATVGYDLCTGWGSFNDPLIPALLNPPSERLVLNPPDGFTSFGPPNGPYSVSSQSYTVNNIGSAPVTWQVINTNSWLNVSSTGGTLGPGGSASFSASLNASANNFMIAHNDGNVLIENLTDGTFQNREFILDAGNGDFETGDLTYWDFFGSTNLVFALAGDDVDVAGTNALDGEPDELFVHSGLYGAYLGEWPSNGAPAIGSLSQTLATTAGQDYVLSFWLTCVPYQGSTTPNSFAARWNGLPIYSHANLPAFGWTNLQYVLRAPTAHTPLEFDFDNYPGAFGLDDITVEPLPAPMVQPAAVTNGVITLSWSSIATVSYQVQSAANPASTTWSNVGSPIIATGPVTSASEPIGGGARLFYRVVMTPP